MNQSTFEFIFRCFGAFLFGTLAKIIDKNCSRLVLAYRENLAP